MSKTALLVIDMQRDFLETDGRLPIPAADAHRVIEVANRMIQHARQAGWAIIWIKNEFLPTQWIGNFFRKYAAMRGSRGAEIDSRVNFAEAPLVIKSQADGFSNPKLEVLLRDVSPERIIILGLMTDECVKATARGAICRGFRVEIVEDGVATLSDSLHQSALAKMKLFGAELKQSTDLIVSVPLR